MNRFEAKHGHTNLGYFRTAVEAAVAYARHAAAKEAAKHQTRTGMEASAMPVRRTMSTCSDFDDVVSLPDLPVLEEHLYNCSKCKGKKISASAKCGKPCPGSAAAAEVEAAEAEAAEAAEVKAATGAETGVATPSWSSADVAATAGLTLLAPLPLPEP